MIIITWLGWVCIFKSSHNLVIISSQLNWNGWVNDRFYFSFLSGKRNPKNCIHCHIEKVNIFNCTSEHRCIGTYNHDHQHHPVVQRVLMIGRKLPSVSSLKCVLTEKWTKFLKRIRWWRWYDAMLWSHWSSSCDDHHNTYVLFSVAPHWIHRKELMWNAKNL